MSLVGRGKIEDQKKACDGALDDGLDREHVDEDQ
jgi:hypothetical protein